MPLLWLDRVSRMAECHHLWKLKKKIEIVFSIFPSSSSATLPSLLMPSPLVLSLQQQSCCLSHTWLNICPCPSLSCFFLPFMFACSLSCSSVSLFLTSSTCSRLDMYSVRECVCVPLHSYTLAEKPVSISVYNVCTLQLAATFTPPVQKWISFLKSAPVPRELSAEGALVGM